MIEDTNITGDTKITIDEPNRWRLETPGHQGWAGIAPRVLTIPTGT
jgi:hypothetical protein